MKVGGDVLLGQRLEQVFGEGAEQTAGLGFCRAADTVTEERLGLVNMLMQTLHLYLLGDSCSLCPSTLNPEQFMDAVPC